jgi:drug/metabolite transporter (DMT)-like permease
MDISQVTESLGTVLPFIFLAEGVIAAAVWFVFGGKGSRGAKITAWIGLTTLTLWCGSAIAFVALHALLFSIGRDAAMVGLILTTIFMVTMPFGWALVIRHRARKEGRTQS